MRLGTVKSSQWKSSILKSLRLLIRSAAVRTLLIFLFVYFYLFIYHYVFLSCFVSLFGCYDESTCLLRDLENTFALSLESVYSIGDWCSVF